MAAPENDLHESTWVFAEPTFWPMVLRSRGLEAMQAFHRHRADRSQQERIQRDPHLWLYLAGQWLDTRGYPAEVLIDRGAPLLVRIWSGLHLRLIRWYAANFTMESLYKA